MPRTAAAKFTFIMRVIFCAWLIALVVISLFPVNFKAQLHTTGPYHDVDHYLAFLVTGIFLWVITTRAVWKIAAFISGVVFAFAQEWTENHFYHAGFEWKDCGNDVAGLVSGFSLMVLVYAVLTDGGPRRSKQRY